MNGRPSPRGSSWPGPVLRVDERQMEALKLSRSPSTLIVDGTGRVQKVWNGLWRREDFQEAVSLRQY